MQLSKCVFLYVLSSITKTLLSTILSLIVSFGYCQISQFDLAKKSANIDSAIVLADRYLQVLEEKGDQDAVVQTLCFLAKQYTLRQRYSLAEKTLDRAAAIAGISDNKLYHAMIGLQKANLYKYQNEFAAALENYLQSEKVFEELKLFNLLSECRLELAEFHRKLGKYKLANQYIHLSFNTFHKNELQDTTLLIRIYNRAAAIDNESNPDHSATIRNSNYALRLATKINDQNAIATSLNELGFTYKNMHKNDSSEYFYKEAERIWFENGFFTEAIHAMNNRAMLYAHNSYPQQQIFDIYFDIIRKVKEYKIDFPLNDVYQYLYIEYLEAGDTGKAFNYFHSYHIAELASESERNDINILNIKEKYENEKIKNNYREVTNKLNESYENIFMKNKENTNLFIFVLLLLVTILVILFLAYKLRWSNRKLKIKNQEKDMLIQEIHHRVKNNLQFISSLVNMQIKASENKSEYHTLSDASRRINAMALVHEMLYNQEEQKGISIKLYLDELIASLKDMVHTTSKPIQFDSNIYDVNFTVQEAISLGMITSEIVSNSMKHAFKNTDRPVVKIILVKSNSKQIRYSIRDNGRGFDITKKKKETLGLRLIDIFSRQLKGEYKIMGDGCFEYEINFNIK